MENRLESAGIIGLGLIGGSLGLALRAQGVRVVGWDRPEPLAAAAKRGALSAPAAALGEACQAQVVVLAAPVGAILDLLPEVLAAAPADSLVTDTGSTKAVICRRAAAWAQGRGPAALFVGGHPVAGGEGSGIEASRESLFAGAPWLLAGAAGDARAQRWEHALRRLGARPGWLAAERHDELMARLSHLPQLVSTALAAQLLQEFGLPLDELQYAGPGLRDMLRLAGSSYALWRDILLTNGEEIAGALNDFEQLLDHMRQHLRTRELEGIFAQARRAYAARPSAPRAPAREEP